MNLLDLDDDFLAHICQYFVLEEQLIVKHICTRFRDIIHALWRQQKIIELTTTEMAHFETIPTDFVEYFGCASRELQQLKMGRVSRKQLQLLTNLNFANVTILECTTWRDEVHGNDEDIPRMVNLFSSLTKLSLASNISGQYVTGWRHLTELELSCCDDLLPQYLVEIFRTLKLRKFSLFLYNFKSMPKESLIAIGECETLEELHIQDYLLMVFIDVLLRMPNMRKILCYIHPTVKHHKALLRIIANTLRARIHTLKFAGVFWNGDENLKSLLKMTKLQNLVMFKEEINDEQIQKIAKNMPNLRSFEFVDGYLPTEESILHIVEQCKQLEVLNVAHTSVTVPLLERIIDALRMGERSQALRLYCAGTEIASVDLKDMKIPEYLHIIRTENSVVLPTHRNLVCEWWPQKENVQNLHWGYSLIRAVFFK